MELSGGITGPDTSPGFKPDGGELQQLQDVYSAVTNLFIFCVDDSGSRITEMSGDPAEINRILGLIDESQMISVIRRVFGNSIEEQVIEDTAYSNIKIASIAVRIDGKPAFCWFVCGVLEDDGSETAVRNIHSTVSHNNFIRSIDLLRISSKRMYSNAATLAGVSIQQKRMKSSEKGMMDALKRSESMTEIVQLLDSDDPFDDIAEKILSYAGRYVGISHAYMLRLDNHGRVELGGEYLKDGEYSLDEEFKDIPLDILHALADRPTVISYKTQIDPGHRMWLNKLDISALLALPIVMNSRPIMYMFFADNTPEREWSMEDSKFFGDAVRVLQSIVTRRLQKNSITGSYKSLEAILDNVGSAIYVKDLESGEILFANRMCRSTFSSEMQDGTLEKLFESKVESGSSAYREVEYPEKRRWYDLNMTYISWVDGRRVCLNSLFDITDKKTYQRRIEQQANNDFLTGLYNRMCCERDLMRFVDEAKASGSKGAVIYLDLDDFKHINDGLGHQYGDVLLKAISNSLRRIDGVESTCYRMGGDEFVIIVPSESYPKFEKILEQISLVFNKPWFLKGADYYCTSSIGIVTFPDDGETVQDLIKKADIAMYEAKKSGKNKKSVYSKGKDAASSKRLDMEKSMRSATTDDYREFEVYFQPIVDIRKPGSQCTGAEALIRWNSSSMGMVSPGDFIPLAEYLGLINPIGNYVLKEACLACKHWNESGHPYYKVNVNLSVVQLLQNDIVDTVSRTIEETGINPRNLTLEVTESLAINDMTRMKKILNGIKQLGVRLALDDFGTGYSSLNHIREIPFDVIKVDQSFVKDLATDQYAQSFIKMIGELATALGVKICVEGIETREQFQVIENMNVRLIQGFYFDRPMPRDKFEARYV